MGTVQRRPEHAGGGGLPGVPCWQRPRQVWNRHPRGVGWVQRAAAPGPEPVRAGEQQERTPPTPQALQRRHQHRNWRGATGRRPGPGAATVAPPATGIAVAPGSSADTPAFSAAVCTIRTGRSGLASGCAAARCLRRSTAGGAHGTLGRSAATPTTPRRGHRCAPTLLPLLRPCCVLSSNAHSTCLLWLRHTGLIDTKCAAYSQRAQRQGPCSRLRHTGLIDTKFAAYSKRAQHPACVYGTLHPELLPCYPAVLRCPVC